MHPYHHALSSVRHYGGKVDDYLPLHNWFDASKAGFGDARHRACRHHVEGIEWAEDTFGVLIKNADDNQIPVKELGSQHLMEDFGQILKIQDWAATMPQCHPLSKRAVPDLNVVAKKCSSRFGGEGLDYVRVLKWFAEFDTNDKGFLRLHTEGLFWAEEWFGVAVPLSNGKVCPVRPIGEAYLMDRFGRMPVLADWLRKMKREKWMANTNAEFARLLAELDE